jgi:N-methylhydantoinase A
LKSQRAKKIGIEIGGTFTDTILLNEKGEIIKTLKLLSTPKNPEIAVFRALSELAGESDGIEVLVHGSTVATNSVLERKGKTAAFLTTKGFGDLLEIQRHDRVDIYDIFFQKPAPLVPRDRVFEIDERIMANGEVSRPLNKKAVSKIIEKLVTKEKIESIAVCLLNSYINPIHENIIKEIIEKEYPNIFLTLSSEILPEFREYERASTTVLSAYVRPIIDHYIGIIENKLDSFNVDELWIVQSNGGILPGKLARTQAVRCILSGPAGGVTGAVQLANEAGFPNIITFDMGGTSTDVCLVTGGKPEVSTECKIDNLPLRIPMFDIISVGAGGGSIAWLDAGGMLRVGPQSAGADPGPVCYGVGGDKPTVTDANVELGLIRPENFLGGKMKLNGEGAHKALTDLGKQMKMGAKEAAVGVFKVANANMGRAIRLVSIEKGFDPRDYVLVAFGGAGPLHAAYLAAELEISQVLIPRNPGLLSAYGLLAADFRRDFVQTKIQPLTGATSAEIGQMFKMLKKKAAEELKGFGMEKEIDKANFTCELAMRYIGQAFEMTIPVDLKDIEKGNLEKLGTDFDSIHLKRYGHCSPEEPKEIVNYRLILTIAQDRPISLAENQKGGTVHQETRPISLEGQEEGKFYQRKELPAGFLIEGPAVIEEDTSTCLVPKGWYAEIDKLLNIILKRGLNR